MTAKTKTTLGVDGNMSYFDKVDSSSLKSHKIALQEFTKNLDDAISLVSKDPIFLDTSVLLRYYNISFAAREQLFDFIENNKKRIYLTNQVRYEFLKNRENSISNFFDLVTEKIPKDFTDIVNQISNFLNQHKDLLNDYPFVQNDLSKTKKSFDELLIKLNNKAKEKKEANDDLIPNDKFLDLLIDCCQYDGLTKKEIELVKKDFDCLKGKINIDKISSEISKPRKAFPGISDIKEKPDNPYGDFIIYHELLKYSKNNSTNVIFLTLDNTKGDWMKKDKSPHHHYVENFYQNTSKLLFIIDAERTLRDVLNINVDSLVTVTSESVTRIPYTFFNQTPPPGHPDLDDHYYPELLSLSDFEYRITIYPVSVIEHWRFGVKFLRDPSAFSTIPRHQIGNPLLHLEKNPGSQELKLSYYNAEKKNEYCNSIIGNYFDQTVIIRLRSESGVAFIDVLNSTETSVLDHQEVILGYTLCYLVAWADSRNTFELKTIIDRYKV